MPAYGGEGEFPLPEAMTPEDIRWVVQGFAEAARNASRAGFNGVEIHGANGYLIDQFLTDYTNVRNDPYGGSIENQVRIVHEIIGEIRKAVPKNFIIGLRLSEAKVNNLSYRWPEGAARARPCELLDPIRGRGDRAGKRVGRQQEQRTRGGVNADGVAVREHPPHDRRGLGREVRVDEEERRAHAFPLQQIEQVGRRRRIGSIVVGEIDGYVDRRPGLVVGKRLGEVDRAGCSHPSGVVQRAVDDLHADLGHLHLRHLPELLDGAAGVQPVDR